MSKIVKLLKNVEKCQKKVENQSGGGPIKGGLGLSSFYFLFLNYHFVKYILLRKSLLLDTRVLISGKLVIYF